MASRQIKMPAKNHAEQEVEEVLSQSKRPERGRYLLQVDRRSDAGWPSWARGLSNRVCASSTGGRRHTLDMEFVRRREMSDRCPLYPQKRTSVECSECPLSARNGHMHCSK